MTFNRCLVGYDDLHRLLFLAKDVEEFALIDSRVREMTAVQDKEKFAFSMVNLKTLDLSGTMCKFSQNIESFATLDFTRMLGNCSSLESLSADISLLKDFPFHKKKLKSLRMDRVTPLHLRIADTLQAQFNLTTLDLMNCFIMDDVLIAVRNLERLNVLKIDLSGLTSGGFLTLGEMSLKELHYKARRAKWIVLAMSKNNHLFSTISVLYADIDELLIKPSDLVGCFRPLIRLKSIHIKTNSTKIIDSIFASERHTLSSCTVELSNVNCVQPLTCFSPKITGISSDAPLGALKELKIINSEKLLVNTSHFSFLRYFKNIKKLSIIGFVLEEKHLIWTLKHLQQVEHFELRSIDNGIYKTSLIFDNSLLNKIEKQINRNIKVLSIECKQIELSGVVSSSLFPVIQHKQPTHIVLRHR